MQAGATKVISGELYLPLHPTVLQLSLVNERTNFGQSCVHLGKCRDPYVSVSNSQATPRTEDVQIPTTIRCIDGSQ